MRETEIRDSGETLCPQHHSVLIIFQVSDAVNDVLYNVILYTIKIQAI